MWELVESIRGIKEALEGGSSRLHGCALACDFGKCLYNESKNGSVVRLR